ncbi:hypothetical protein FIU89_07320 [Roseovarius sp. THAF27]|uniref:hypothetical protein n=1 Tax=unclassified Roseovarius TaxID=2614913 RepID=UPI0012684711|nr:MULTISPECIES: hypothetical protein [unclassified Roseovarius]QFT80416.1 hypothetical protein FIU89_07320 [Roseovarius sp. THAF27]QFT96455.1 hypothetical protein FIU85_04000 [Roseovarius sp. THAF8]
MQVVIHAGAHMTDEDRLIETLMANREMLAEIGTDVPDPKSYRKLLRDILNTVSDRGLTAETRNEVLAAVDHDPGTDRLVLSNQAFFGTPKMAVGQGMFYPAAETRIAAFQEIFANDQLELFLGLRDPATHLPALFAKTPHDTMADFLNGVEPSAFRWSETIARFRRTFPEMPITVWCNEDSPLIWSQVVREMAGLDPHAQFEGEFALLQEIMTSAGMKRFETYLASHPGMTEIQKRRVISAFLDKFVKDEEIEEELDLPGWTAELVDTLSEAYDEDVYEIERIQGVQFIAP